MHIICVHMRCYTIIISIHCKMPMPRTLIVQWKLSINCERLLHGLNLSTALLDKTLFTFRPGMIINQTQRYCCSLIHQFFLTYKILWSWLASVATLCLASVTRLMNTLMRWVEWWTRGWRSLERTGSTRLEREMMTLSKCSIHVHVGWAPSVSYSTGLEI